jgi:hypothetical protein
MIEGKRQTFGVKRACVFERITRNLKIVKIAKLRVAGCVFSKGAVAHLKTQPATRNFY